MTGMPRGNAAGMAQQLIAAERGGQDKIYSQRESLLDSKLDAYRSLKSSLKGMQKQFTELGKGGFDSKQAAFGDSKFAEAKVDAKAPVGEYQIEVTQLAQSHKLSAEFASEDAKLPNTGQFAFDVNGKSLSLDFHELNKYGDKTVTDLVSMINGASDNPGATAALIRKGDGSVELMLSAKESGSENKITVTHNATDSRSFKQLSAGQDAKFTLNGIAITSSSNSVDEVVDGISLELKQLGKETLKVEQDKEGLKEQIEDFVDNYNDLLGAIGDLTQAMTVEKDEDDFSSDDDDDEDDEHKSAIKEVGEDEIGVLKGDATVRRLTMNLRELVQDKAGNGMALRDLGIEMDRYGKLKLDDDKLESALSKDGDKVEAMFAGKGGYIEKVDEIFKPFTKFNGYLDTKKDSIKTQQRHLEHEMEAFDYRMKQKEQMYLSRFAAAEQYQNQMVSTSQMFFGPTA